MMLNIYIDEDTLRRLTAVANHLGRTVPDLAESAISEQAIRAVVELRLDTYTPAEKARSS